MLQSKHIRKYKFILMDNSKDEAPTASASEPSRITSISSRIASIKRKRQQQRDCPLVIPEQRRSYRIRYIPKKKHSGVVYEPYDSSEDQEDIAIPKNQIDTEKSADNTTKKPTASGQILRKKLNL